MSRIQSCMQALADRSAKAVVPYLVAGDPLPAVTVTLMHQLVEDGADIIELGIPFSDPMAEGPVIQKAHERALAHRVSLKSVLAMVEEFRRKNTETPVVLMGYANPVIAMGYAAFASAASKAGVDGVLTVDLPPEESEELTEALAPVGIDSIYLIAPTTTEERIKAICSKASGYIYYVSLKGVTGAGHLDTAAVEENISKIKQYTSLPVCVGFGIKDASSAQAVAACADGVVVGSALVDKFAVFETDDANAKIDGELTTVLQQTFSPIVQAVPGH